MTKTPVDEHEVPQPPDRVRRGRKLPAETPKHARDDPEAARRVTVLMEHDSYRDTAVDKDFPDDPNLRGLRLQIDYLKPELRLQAAGVANTIVVFGGTRIVEESAARREVESLQRACAERPDDERLLRELRRAENILGKSGYYRMAREFGAIVGNAGTGPQDCRLTLMTGGGPGIMEAANRGAADVGAKSIGLNITLPREQYPNPYITPGLCFKLRYFAIRKLHFLLRARALVIFPGGYGTLDELFETLNLVQTRTIDPLPVVLVGMRFWQRLIDFDALVTEGVIDPEDRQLFWFAETAQEAWDGICEWHERAGVPLICPAHQVAGVGQATSAD